MGDKTGIQWTDATWNPIVGCDIVSTGCKRCYAMKLAGTRLRDTARYRGLTTPSNAGPVWNGEVRFIDAALDQPCRWSKPRMIFVNSMGDLYHEKVPDEWIDKVKAIEALTLKHTYQELTKRHERMRAYHVGNWHERVALILNKLKPSDLWNGSVYNALEILAARRPLPNVWLGVSAERQEEADERIPALLAAPAAIHFVSAEPLISPIFLTKWLHDSDCDIQEHGAAGVCTCAEPREVSVDWVIAGGESGDGARPMHPEWTRSLRDQCAEAGVAFHFKQWGEWAPEYIIEGPNGPSVSLVRVGKKAAGRLLDGREHNGFPG